MKKRGMRQPGGKGSGGNGSKAAPSGKCDGRETTRYKEGCITKRIVDNFLDFSLYHLVHSAAATHAKKQRKVALAFVHTYL